MIPMPPVTSTIEEGKQYLRKNWEKGVPCPCCGQMVKLYTRHIYARMALDLIDLYKLDRNNPNQYFHITEIEGNRRSGGGDFAKLVYWGLVVEQKNDDETKRTSGYWAITKKGRDFVNIKITVPKSVKIFDGKFFGYSEKHVTIRDSLGKKFDYSELMFGFENPSRPENERLL